MISRWVELVGTDLDDAIVLDRHLEATGGQAVPAERVHGTGRHYSDTTICNGIAVLNLRHLPVPTVPRHEFFVGAALDDPAGIHDQDEVGVPDGRKPVGDDETGPVPA